MKFNKVIIDGKEYYEKIEEEKCESVLNENESEDSDIKCFEKTAKEDNSGKDFLEKLSTGAKELGEKLLKGAKDIGSKIKSGSEKIFSKEKYEEESTEEKLLCLLPFMTKEDAHGVALKLTDSEKILKALDISKILPHFTESDCDMIFIRAVEVCNTGFDMEKIRPYISEECISNIAEGYIIGKYPDFNIDILYPYLSENDIRRIFCHIIDNEKLN